MNQFVKSMLALAITGAMTLPMANAATYKVIDKGVSTAKYTYGQQSNNADEMVLTGTKLYNVPVQFEYFTATDLASIILYAEVLASTETTLGPIEDAAALVAGNPTGNDLSWVIKWLESEKSTNYFYQKVSGTNALLNSGVDSSEFTVFDEPLDDSGQPSRSTLDIVKGVTDTGWLYGSASAPYLPKQFIDSAGNEFTYWYREFSSRGFYSPDRGASVYSVIPPSEDINSYGGVSGILDVSDTAIAVGYMSTEMSENTLESIESVDGARGCANPDYIDDYPQELCIQDYRDSSTVLGSDAYQLRAFKSSLTDNGQVVTENLGLLNTPDDEDSRTFISVAQAVNNYGVAVGFSHGWVDKDKIDPSSTQARSFYAVVYKEGDVVSLSDSHTQTFNSRAYDINDSGIAVGHVTKSINGDLRTKFYYVDTTNVDEMEMVTPTDFFDSSSSTARAINESGFIVGEGEYETHNDNGGATPRRTHAFIYDINNDKFTDVNDLLSCTTEYDIIEARDINDDNVITASAVYKVQSTNAKGELIFDESGEPIMEDVIRAVTLEPMEDDGEVCTPEELGKLKRQGASFNMFSLFGLFGLLLARRKMRSMMNKS